jgi:hypothetical protein
VHDQHNGTLELVVQPAVEGMVEPLVGCPRLVCDNTSSGLKTSSDQDVREAAAKFLLSSMNSGDRFSIESVVDALRW